MTVALRILTGLLLAFSVASAQDYVWGGAGADDNWSSNANWAPPTGNPSGTSDTATFSGSTRPGPVLDAARTVNRLTFSSATSFTLGAGAVLTLSGTAPEIVATQGAHTIACGISLAANTVLRIQPGASLGFTGAIITNGFSLTFADTTAPTIATRRTRDLDGDGQIDAVDMSFNEAMDQTSTRVGTWTVTGYTLAPPPLWLNATTLRVPVVERSAPDTSALPNVRHQINASNEIRDLAGNFLATEVAGGVQPQDGAPPAITTVFGTTGSGSVTVNFSEPVGSDILGSPLAANDVVYVDGNASGATAILSVSEGNGQDASATFTTNVVLTASDIGTDRVRASAGQIVDLAGNVMDTSRLVLITTPQTFVTTTAAGDWLDATKWSSLAVPTSGDAVKVLHAMVIPTTGSDNPYIVIRTLTIGSGGSITALNNVVSTNDYCIIALSGRYLEAQDDTTVTNVQFYDEFAAADTVFRVAATKTLTLLNATQGQFVKQVVKQGAGTLVWSSPPNAFADGSYDDGLTRVEDGIMRVTVASARPDGYPLSVNAGATFRFTGAYAPSSLDGAGTVGIHDAVATTLTVGSGTWSGLLSNLGAQLAVTVAGTSTWQGANTFSGRLTVNVGGSLTVNGAGNVIPDGSPVTCNGALVVQSSEVIGPLDGSGTMSLTGNLTVNHAATATAFTGVIGGAGGLSISGTSGSLSLGLLQTYAGGTFLRPGGALVAAGNTALGAAAGALVFDGGTLRLSGDLNTTDTLADATNEGSAPAVQIPAAAANRPVSVTANDGFIDLQLSSLALPGFDTAVGQDLTISAGADGDRTLFVNLVSGVNTWAGRLLKPAASPTTETFGWFIKRGAGTLVLANAGNTWVKNIARPEQGTLRVTADGALGQVNLWVFTLAAGTFELATNYSSGVTHFLSGIMRVTSGTCVWGGVTYSYPDPFASPTNVPVFDVSAGATLDLSGQFTYDRPWQKTGAGALALSSGINVNSVTAGGTISGGVLRIARDDLLGQVSNGLVIDGGTLAITGPISTTRAITIGASGGVIDVDPAATLSLAGVVSGGGLFTKDGNGPLTLAGANTYTGDLRILNGTVLAGADAALGSNAGTIADIVLAGGQLQATASFALASSRVTTVSSPGGKIAVDSAATLTLNGLLSGAAPLTVVGPGTLSLGGANTLYTGTITVASGTLRTTTGTALGDFAPTNQTIVQDGATIDLAGTFTCPETLSLAGSGVGGTGTLVASSGAPTITGGVVLNRTLNPVVVSVPSGPLIINAVVSNQSDLVKTGAGALHLIGVNTYTGQNTVTAGAIAISANSGLGDTDNEVLLAGGILRALANVSSTNRSVRISTAGGTIDTSTGFNITLPGLDTGPAQNLTLAGTGSLVLNIISGQRTLAGKISGTAGLTKSGGGDLGINSVTNDLTGLTLVTNGGLGVSGILPGTVTVAGGGALGGTGTIGTLNVQAGGIVSPGGANAGVLSVATLNPSANCIFAMNIGAASDLISVTGSGTVALNGSVALIGEDNAPNGTYTLVNAPSGSVTGSMAFSPDPNDTNARYLLATTPTQLQVVRDSVTPSVIAITSPDPDGEYVSGDSVTVRVVFSEPVNLTGGLRLTLNTAPSVVTVDIPASAVGVFTAAFDGTYVVVAPQVAADLDVTAIVLLSSGTYADSVGNTVLTVSLPSSGQNLGGLKNIAIVNRAPVVQINGAAVGDTTPPAYALASAGATVLLCDPAVSGKLDVVAVDPEAASPLTWTLRLDPSVGVLERFDTAWEPVQTTVSSTFTQDDVQNNRVRYRHTGSVGGNDAVLVDCQDPQGNVSPLFLIRFSIAGNGPPVVANFDGDTLSYLEPSTKPGPYLAIDGDLTVTSVQPALTGGTLNITVLNGTTDDQLDLIAPATVSAGTVSLSGTPVATVTNLGSNAVSFTLLAGATPANTAALIKSVGYRSNDVSPSVPGNRSINLTITDGTPGGGITVVAKAIALDPWNEAPVVSGADVATVPGLTRTGSITATDPEGLAQNQMTLSVVQNPALGTLVFNASAGTYSYTPNFLPALTSDNVVLDTFIIGATDQAFAATNPRVASPSDATGRTPARIGQHTVTVRITNSGATGLTFRNAPRMTVNTGGIFNYLPQVNALPGAVLSYELINNPVVTGFNPTTGLTNWNPVPAAGASGYYRFGLLVTDATSGISAYLPIMLRVGPGGTG